MGNNTKWERELINSGRPIITWDHDSISNYLVDCFKRDYAQYLMMAAADSTRRHNLRFVLNFHDVGGVNFGGTVNYNKKKRLFDFIEYSDRRNYSVRISIRNPKIYCPANPKFHQYSNL